VRSDLCLSRRSGEGAGEGDVADLRGDGEQSRRGAGVDDGDADSDVRAVGPRQRQVGHDMRIAEADGAGGFERYALPEARVAVAYAGDPVPPFGGDEGRPVDGELAAVLADAALDRLFVRDAGVRGGLTLTATTFSPGRG